jgi:RND superfamily putative drug exporter
MAKLLYRLGFGSAKRAWLVIISWIMILGISLGAMFIGGTKLSENITIDGIASQQVIDQLKASFPSASGGSAQVVFHVIDGTKFTKAEEAAISSSLERAAKITGVDTAINPFVAQAELEKQRSDAANGIKKLDAARQEIDSGQSALDAGKLKLDASFNDLTKKSVELETGIAQAIANKAPAEMLNPLLANRAQIAAGFAEIKKQRELLLLEQKKIDEGSAAIDANASKLKYGNELLAVSENFGTVSRDRATALAIIQFDLPITQVSKATLAEVTDIIASAPVDGVQIEYSKEFTSGVSDLLGVGEIVGLVIAAVVLFLMLGTFVSAGLPVLAAILGVGVAATATLAMSSLFEMNSTTPVLGVMLGLAVGIDYSLFILNRHIRQLKAGVGVRESIGLATGTSGNAVVFAGLTVVIALVALNLTGIAFLGIMGTMGALGIVVAVLVALTFTPAMLGLLGLRVLSKKNRALLAAGKPNSEAAKQKREKKSLLVTRQPWLIAISSIAVLVVAALPSASMRLGLPDGSSEPIESSQYKAYKLTTQAFGEGANGAVIAVAHIPEALSSYKELKLQAGMAKTLFELKNVDSVLPGGVSKDGTTFIYQVVPTSGPASVETQNLVYDIRELAPRFETDFQSTLGVTGLAATNIDVSKKLADALPLYLGTVLALSMLLMMLVFRSILVPILASAGFLLTVFAVFGSITAVFQWGWLGSIFGVHDPGPILSFLPTIMIGILFGLAMDYQLFLTSGIREAFTHGKTAKESINYGIRLSRSVVVAAAIIMVSVFGGFAFSHLAMIRPMGFGLAAGVLFDAFIVRLLLVPSVMSIVGKAAWWMPKWLDRILPDVDVEGSALEREQLH